MVKHWLALKTPGWEMKAAINATGAVATAVVLIVVTAAKFTHGAWMVLLIIPILVAGFGKIATHYRGLAAMLSPEGHAPPRAIRHTVLVLVPGFHRGVLDAVAYARTISPDPEAVFVEIDPRDTPALQEHWRRAGLGIPLTVLKSPWRSLAEPIIQYTRTLRAEKHVEMVTVIIPEFVTTQWWHRLLHNQSGLMLKLALMFEPGVVVTNVRYRPRPAPPES
jgi:hypothetical protein